MRVLVIEREVYPFAVGGSEVHAYYVSRELARRGHKVYLFTEKPGNAGEGFFSGWSITLITLKKVSLRFFSVLLYLSAGFLKLLSVARRVDVIQAHKAFAPMVLGAVLSFVFGKPFFVTCHGSDVRLLRWNPLVRAVQRLFLRRASAVFCVSREILNIVGKDYGVPRGRLVLVMNGYSEDAVHSVMGRPKNPLGGGRRSIVFVGSLRGVKDPLTAVETVEELVKRGFDVSLTIIGVGGLYSTLQDYVASHGLEGRVSFAGSLSNIETLRRIRDADVLLLTSVQEGLPTVVVEAMALGTPVVASNLRGVSEVIVGGVDGVLVPPGSPKLFADAVERVFSDDDFAAELARNARRKVSGYSWEAIAGVYEGVYKSFLLGGHS